jgi:hypothetical protein
MDRELIKEVGMNWIVKWMAMPTVREIGSYGSVLADVVDSSVGRVVKGLPVPGFEEVLAVVQISDDVASFDVVGSVPGL